MLEKVHPISFKVHADHRGILTVVQSGNDIPFDIKRIFYISDVPNSIERGGHSHYITDQVAIALVGSVRVIVNDGLHAKQIVLDHSNYGIFLPRMTWSVLTDFSPGAICMVLANTEYHSDEYIRSWSEYLSVRNLPFKEEFRNSSYPSIS